MRLVKKFERDERTDFVSSIFDKLIVTDPFPLPFSRIELHIRDYDVTVFDNEKAIICINYNNPLILEMDERGVRTILRHELFRLMLRVNYPRQIEDVMVGREMILRGYGDDLFYMYYSLLMKTDHDDTRGGFVKASLPWVIFYGLDDYNSKFLKELVGKIYKRKYPETAKFLSVLCKLSGKNLKGAVKEYEYISD